MQRIAHRPSAEYEHVRREGQPGRPPARHTRDQKPQSEIQRVYDDDQLWAIHVGGVIGSMGPRNPTVFSLRKRFET